MKKLIVLIPVLMLLACTFACQTNPKMEAYDDQVDEELGLAMKVPVYFWDRFLDLTDVVQLNLGFGDGFLFNIHATKLFQMGLGYRDGVCVGLMPRSFGMWHEDRVEGGVAFPIFFGDLYYKNLQREALFGTPTLFDHDVCFTGADHRSNDSHHWSDLGFSLHLFVLGLDAELSPVQVFDFVFGFFGMPYLIPVDPIGFGTELDIANDDMRARLVRNASDMPYYLYNQDSRPGTKACCGGEDCTGCK